MHACRHVHINKLRHTHTHRSLVRRLRHLLFVVHKLLIAVNRESRGKQTFLMLMKFSRPVSPFKPTLCYRARRHDKRRISPHIFPTARGEGGDAGSDRNKVKTQREEQHSYSIPLVFPFFFWCYKWNCSFEYLSLAKTGRT